MLIRSNQLTLNEASSILDNGVYLTEAEAALNPVAVPVLENQRLGICTVSYNDIQRVCEDYGCYNEDALHAIAEASGIDVDNIAVAIDESDIILDPEIVNEFAQYVVKPISENSLAYIFCEASLEQLIDTGDSDYLYFLENVNSEDALCAMLLEAMSVEEYYKSLGATDKMLGNSNSGVGTGETDWSSYVGDQNILKIQRPGIQRNQVRRLNKLLKSGKLDKEGKKRVKDMIKKIEAKLGGAQETKEKTIKSINNGTNKDLPPAVSKAISDAQSSNDPGFISKKVAALRNFYKKFLDQANKEHDENKISWYKNIARVILNVIDKLLAKIQGNNGAGSK